MQRIHRPKLGNRRAMAEWKARRCSDAATGRGTISWVVIFLNLNSQPEIFNALTEVRDD
jgi:hypothetical protein